jgi:sugar phosphate isomerase/epimerase
MGGAAAATLLNRSAFTNPLGLPLGLQPYTVRNDLQADFMGTLKKVMAMGYQEIELSGGPGYGDFYGHKPAELKKILDDLGLPAASCHYRSPNSDTDWANDINDAHTLGVKYMVCSTPPAGPRSVEFWKQTAAFFNHLGARCRDAGIQFAYHNHNSEFRVFEGVPGYDLLLRESDRSLVKMEMDCFWVTFAGQDPVRYLQRYPGRFPLLHIKDLKRGYAPTTGEFEGNPFTEVGAGVIDWKRIFSAAPKAGVTHYYVEQDMWDGPSLESARSSADYLKKLSV